jgi:O-antigen/teichoic acid export membrane protein
VALTTRIMRHTIVILGVICIIIFALAGLLQSVLFSKYDGMATALRFLLPGVLLYSLAQAYSAFYTYQRGWPWVSAIVAGGGLIVDLSLDFALIPSMGVNGAALASSIAYSVAITGGLIVFVRTEHVRASDVFRFGRADMDDYRTLVTRLRARF